jgi:hypothetical protein
MMLPRWSSIDSWARSITSPRTNAKNRRQVNESRQCKSFAAKLSSVRTDKLLILSVNRFGIRATILLRIDWLPGLIGALLW